MLLGDVVVADQVDSYLDRSKAVPNGEDRFTLIPGGEVYRPTAALLPPIRNMQFAHTETYENWSESCRLFLEHNVTPEELKELSDNGWIGNNVTLAIGHLASGPTVGAAKAFANWLKNRDRNILCLEMEAAGIAGAVNELIAAVNFIVVRGISDLADENKGELDRKYHANMRRYAMHNAIQLLKRLMDIQLLPLAHMNSDSTANITGGSSTALTIRPGTGALAVLSVHHSPLRFSWADLKELIGSLHDVLSREFAASISKYDFTDTDLDMKNRLNRLGADYFQEMKSRHEPYFERIREFLESPINESSTQLYYDIVSELRMKIAAVSSDQLRFEHILVWFADEALNADANRLRGKKEVLIVLLSFMYFNCDIGKKE